MSEARVRSRRRLAQWRTTERPLILERATADAEPLAWSTPLFELLVEELHAEDALEDLLGRRVEDIDVQHYPQAIAVALMFRHSWRDDDLALVLERLGLGAGELSRGLADKGR